jgi:type IX secretion system PorP/SprF family membrane protein
MLNRIIYIIIITSTTVFSAQAQDLHFSQFYNSPLTCNPANTGFIPDADYRLGGTYRKQWASIPVPYKTMTVFGDAQLMRDKLYNGWLGVGFTILKDEAGTGALQSTKVYGSLAYHQMLGESSLLSVGFNAGWANKKINTSKLTFDNQWNGKFFDITAPTGENFAATSINYLDVHAGVNYAMFPNENTYINMGASVQHVNRPKESFFDGRTDSGRYDNRLPRRYTVFANASIKQNDQVIVNPQAYYTRIANASELVAGVNIQYNVSGDGAVQLLGGAYYRLKDAIVPMLGIQYKSVKFTFTYDVTTSSLSGFNKYRGGSEFNMMHQGSFNPAYKGRRDTRCSMPAF